MRLDKRLQFEQLLEKNKWRLAAVARSYASVDDAEDLFQEMLLQIWKSLDGFEGRAALDTWAYRVALNTASTYQRKSLERRRKITLSDELPEPRAVDTRQPDSAREAIRILDDFIHTLNKVDRAVFLLYLEDFDYHQMAEITGLTENHLSVRISRIKKLYVDTHIGA
jgi:RNA polymerase sigma-70 factor (ECF subfamily)